MRLEFQHVLCKSRIRGAIAAIAATLAVLVLLPQPASAATATVSGTVFVDANRDAARQATEAGRAAHVVYLFRAGGQYLRNATADADGRYTFTDVEPGTYWVEAEWRSLQSDWVPTTTPDLYPRHEITVDGGARTANFGFRRIVRSTDIDAPITRYTGPNGLTTASYNDVVSATAIYDAIVRGTVGAEAPTVTVRFGYADNSNTTTTVSQTNGSYSDFSAAVYVSYQSWLDHRDRILSHEYGHAWSLYHAYISQQEPTLDEYLRVRGLAGDPRLDSSHSWSRRELIAEDYRVLLGSPTAQSVAQENTDIPPAAEVPGLLEYLRETFPSAAEPTPEPTPTASPSPSPSPSPTAPKGSKGGGGGGGKPRK